MLQGPTEGINKIGHCTGLLPIHSGGSQESLPAAGPSSFSSYTMTFTLASMRINQEAEGLVLG